MATIGVKVQLDGSQTYKQQMSAITQQTKLFQAQVKETTNNISKGASVFANHIAQGKALENQLASQREQQKLLANEIEKATEKYGANSKEVMQLETQMTNLRTAITNTESALQSNGGTLGAIGAQFEALGSKISAVGDKIAGVGQKMSTALTVPLVAVGTASVKTAGDFESAMSQVASTMGYTVDELHDSGSDASKTMKDLSDFAKEMGETTAFSASESAEALNYMALAGYDAETSMEMLPTVLNLASAGAMDLASASDMVTDASSALGLSIDETSTMVDEMAKASSKSNTSVSQLGEAILTIGATASNMSGGTTELATSLGVLADNGIKGAEGGTHLRNMMLSLQESAKDGAVDFGAFSVQVYDADGNFRAMSDIMTDLQTNMQGMNQESKDAIVSGVFNKTDLASVNAMLGTSKDRFDELKTAIGDAEGSAQAMADVQLDNFNGQITLLKSALEGVAITIGEKLTPYISKLVEKINNLIDWFNSLSDEQQDMIVKIGLVVGAIGPALMIVGKVISTVGSMASTIGTVVTFVGTTLIPFITGTLVPAITAVGSVIIGTIIPAIASVIVAIAPFLAIGAVIAGVIAGIVLVVKNWGTICDWLSEKWQAFSDWISPILEGIGNFFTTIFEGIGNVIQTVIQGTLDFITGYFQLQFEAWKWLFEGIALVVTTVVTAVTTFVTNAVTAISEWINTTITNIKAIIVLIVTATYNFITSILTKIKTTITTWFTTIKTTISNKVTAIKTAITEVLQGIVDKFTELKDNALTWGKDLIDNFISGIKEKWESLKETVSAVAQTVKDFLGFSEPSKGPLSNFHTYGPDMMENYSNGIKNAQYLVKDAVQSVALDVASTLDSALTSEDIYEAIRQGASDSTTSIVLNNREVTRALSGMGVQFS